jgi:hypothetical protein
MTGFSKRVLAFIVGRPLVAIALVAVVVGVVLLNSRKHTTPVTHREQHVALTDKQQMQLGSQEYAKTPRSPFALPDSIKRRLGGNG